MTDPLRVEMMMPVLSAAVDFLSASLERLGGPWKFPFAGVAIDDARQYSHDKDLAQIWAGCDTAAKEMAVYPLWKEFILAKTVMHVGCQQLLRAHLPVLRNLDLEAFIEISQYFDKVLLGQAVSATTFNKVLTQLEVIGDFPSSDSQERLIRNLIAAGRNERADVDRFRQILISHLPPAESVADIVELNHLSRVVPSKPKQSINLLLKYFYLGCRYPEQLPDQFHQLSCVVGALTSSSTIYRNNDDLVLALRSFVDHICSTTPQQALHSWWHFVFNRPKMSVSEIAAFALMIESVFHQRTTTKSWMEIRSSWLHSVMDLIKSEESGRALVFIALMAQLNSELATSTDTVWPAELDFDSARSCLLRFELHSFSLGLFTKNWKVQRYAFKFSVSKASSLHHLCSALLNLERHLETQVFSPEWPRRVGLWEFPLIALSGSEDLSPLKIIKDSLLKLADSIPIQLISQEFYSGYWPKWRRQVASCQYLYPLCELFIELETGLEFEATVSSWADYRSQWGLHVHSSFTVSMLAQCLLDLERFQASSTLRNAPLWRQRLMDLTLTDEPGRVGAIKRSIADMIQAVESVHWRSEFRRSVDHSNTNEQSFFMQLAASRTIDQVSVLVILAAEMLMLPEGKTLSREWFRTMDECYTSFYLSACLIAFDTHLPDSLLRTEEKHWTPRLLQVRTWNISNVSVRALRTILLLLEGHLDLGFMKPTWPTDSTLWSKFCSWQTTDRGIQLACDMLMLNFRHPLFVFDCRSKPASELLILLDESLPATAFNPSWNRVRGLCRVNLRQDVPSEVVVAVCLDHLTQNIIENGKCISRVLCDIPSTVVQMRETLLAIHSMVDFSPIEPTWTNHHEIWLKGVEAAKQPKELAMLIITFAAFIESLPPTCEHRLSICFRQLREIWEHTLLGVVKSEIPSFLNKVEAPVLLSDTDLEFSRNRRIDMGYDRILPIGLYRILDVEHANIRSANSFADLGMGTGLALLQVFCDSSSSVQKCIGVEASSARFKKSIETAKDNIPCEVLMETPDEFVAASKDQRMLTLRRGDLFECEDGIAADVVLLFVSLTPAMHRRLCKFVSKMRPGSRLITKFNIAMLFDKLSLGDLPFRQIPVNRLDSDRFLLQSCPSSGQHLFVFVKL